VSNINRFYSEDLNIAHYVLLTRGGIYANRADRHQSWAGLIPTVTSYNVFFPNQFSRNSAPQLILKILLVTSITVLIAYTKHWSLNLPVTVTLTNEISCRAGFLLNWFGGEITHLEQHIFRHCFWFMGIIKKGVGGFLPLLAGCASVFKHHVKVNFT